MLAILDMNKTAKNKAPNIRVGFRENGFSSFNLASVARFSTLRHINTPNNIPVTPINSRGADSWGSKEGLITATAKSILRNIMELATTVAKTAAFIKKLLSFARAAIDMVTAVLETKPPMTPVNPSPLSGPMNLMRMYPV